MLLGMKQNFIHTVAGCHFKKKAWQTALYQRKSSTYDNPAELPDFLQ